MKKVLCLLFAISLLVVCILCGCGKSEPQPPYFKNFNWGDTVESVEKREPNCEVEHNGDETTLIRNESTAIKNTGDNPFPFEPSMVEYTFRDDYLKSIYLAGFIEKEACLELVEWIEERFDSRGEMKEGTFVYLSKEIPKTALALSVLMRDVPDANDESLLKHYIAIRLMEYNESEIPQKPELDVRQELINICCKYSFCDSVKGFEIGSQSKTPIENGYLVVAKGSYWPVDDYGNIEELMLFDIEFKATWDGTSSYYDIEVTDDYIREKY